MDRRLSFMHVATLCAAAALLSACGTFAAPNQERMSYASMQSLNPGVSSSWILEEYPFARDVGRRAAAGGAGGVERIDYLVEDPRGDTQALSLFFDARGVLTHKRYAGPHVRPPKDEQRRALERKKRDAESGK